MSKFLTLSRTNWIKGLIITVVMALFTAIDESLNDNFQLTWEFVRPILLVGFGAGKVYIIATLLHNSQGKFFYNEQGESVLKGLK